MNQDCAWNQKNLHNMSRSRFPGIVDFARFTVEFMSGTF